MANQKGKPPQPPLGVRHAPFARLSLILPKNLHTRIKVACAARQRSMRDVLIELLEQHFPPDNSDEDAAHDGPS